MWDLFRGARRALRLHTGLELEKRLHKPDSSPLFLCFLPRHRGGNWAIPEDILAVILTSIDTYWAHV